MMMKARKMSYSSTRQNWITAHSYLGHIRTLMIIGNKISQEGVIGPYLLDIWWDIDIALPNGDPIRNRGSTIRRQPSCVGGKYGLPLSGTDAKKHRLAMTPTNGRIHHQQNI